MQKKPLLKSQEVKVFELIKQAGFDPADFEWKDIPSNITDRVNVPRYMVSAIFYKGTGFFFKFDFKKDQFLAVFSPGDDQVKQAQLSVNWDSQVTWFYAWLMNLKREISQPDPWNNLSKYSFISDTQLIPKVSNEPFTASEIKQISNGINKIRAYIENECNPTEIQKEIIHESVAYIIDSTKRLGKLDFFNATIGTIALLVGFLNIPQERVNDIWMLLKNALNGIINLLQPGLP